jgi:hypothetical protein
MPKDGSRRKFVAASRGTTRHAEVAPCKGQGKDIVAPKPSKGRTLGRRKGAQQQCNSAIRKQGLQKLQLGNTGNVIKTCRKARGLEMGK